MDPDSRPTGLTYFAEQCMKVGNDIGEAISDISSAPPHFAEICTDVNTMSRALVAFQRRLAETSGRDLLHSALRPRLESALENCYTTLKDLKAIVDLYVSICKDSRGATLPNIIMSSNTRAAIMQRIFLKPNFQAEQIKKLRRDLVLRLETFDVATDSSRL